MERIVLEVDDATGKAYNKFDPRAKQEFNRIISLFLKRAINDADSENYQKFLDNIGAAANQNGLNAELLNKLLSTGE